MLSQITYNYGVLIDSTSGASYLILIVVIIQVKTEVQRNMPSGNMLTIMIKTAIALGITMSLIICRLINKDSH